MAFLRVPPPPDEPPADDPNPRGVALEPRNAPASRGGSVASSLRPPGALAPDVFAATCTGCGDCVEACPFDVIRLGDDDMPTLAPERSPCLSCLDVPCASSCGSGALRPVAHPAAIRIGVARVAPEPCRAHAAEPCTVCFDACPFQHRAIRLQGDPAVPFVSPTLCTGCGVCAHVCPDDAIAILPRPPQLTPRRAP